MTTLEFLIKPEDLEEIQDLKELLASLPQNEIDLADTSHGDTYGKLYHVRRLRLEEIATGLELAAAYGDDYLEPFEESATEEERLVKISMLMLITLSIRQRNLPTLKVSDPVTGCSLKTGEADILVPAFEDALLVDEIVDDHEESATRVVRIGLEKASSGKVESINLGVFPHISITEALRAFLYREEGRTATELPITYSDGSQARPFPFLSLEAARTPNSLKAAAVFKVGMVSARHPEMDHLIDFYWFRNQLVSVTRASAETDEVAYQWSKKLLALAKAEGPMRIAFYQTGFPPAAIGFYRAVAEELLESRLTGNLWLEVTPYFYDKRADDYQPGEIWV